MPKNEKFFLKRKQIVTFHLPFRNEEKKEHKLCSSKLFNGNFLLLFCSILFFFFQNTSLDDDNIDDDNLDVDRITLMMMMIEQKKKRVSIKYSLWWIF